MADLPRVRQEALLNQKHPELDHNDSPTDKKSQNSQSLDFSNE
jgi:hypothetical protein